MQITIAGNEFPAFLFGIQFKTGRRCGVCPQIGKGEIQGRQHFFKAQTSGLILERESPIFHIEQGQ